MNLVIKKLVASVILFLLISGVFMPYTYAENKEIEKELEKVEEIEKEEKEEPEQETKKEAEQEKEAEPEQETKAEPEQQKEPELTQETKEEPTQETKVEPKQQKEVESKQETKVELKQEEKIENKNETVENKTEKSTNNIEKYNVQNKTQIRTMSLTPTVIEEGTYYIETVLKSNMILDISNASSINGARLQLSEKNGKIRENQRFIIKNAGNGYYTIQIQHSGKVLDVPGAAKINGTAVQQYQANNTDAQKWLIQKTSDGYYNIVSKCSGLYLDIPSALARNGANLQIYQGNNTNAQKFKLIKINPLVGTQTIPNGTYEINTITNSNIGIEVEGTSQANCANVRLGAQSNIIKRNQRFDITYKGNGYYEIKAKHSGKVLDVAGAGTLNGTNVQQYEANNTNAQKWIIQKNSDNTFSIISKASELFLDVNGGILQNGRNIQVYEGNGSNAQKFKLEKVEKATCNQVIKNGIYEISTPLSSNKVLDISGGSNADGANLQIWDFANVQQQKFQVTYKEGYYEIKALNSGKVLDVAGAGTANGTNVQQYTENDTDAQKWILQDAGGGYFYVMSVCANAYLDVAAASKNNGTNIQIYDWNGTNAQKFKFKDIGVLKGIDISESEGTIIWDNVKKSGEVNFAIIRCGYGSDIVEQDDTKFEKNVSECERLGIPYGVYLYSYAGTRDAGRKEAQHVLRLIRGKNPTYGIWIDIEDTDGYKARNNIAYEKCVEVADEFCKTIKAAGYNNVGIYANLSWFNGPLNSSVLDKYQKWVAEWGNSCNYKKNHVMWQYSSTGTVDGISKKVDMNLYYN